MVPAAQRRETRADGRGRPAWHHAAGATEGSGRKRLAKLSGHQTTPTPEMTQQSSSSLFGGDFGRKCAADGPETGPKLPWPWARTVWDRCWVHPQNTCGQNRPQTGPKMICESSQRWGWFYGRLALRVDPPLRKSRGRRGACGCPGTVTFLCTKPPPTSPETGHKPNQNRKNTKENQREQQKLKDPGPT